MTFVTADPPDVTVKGTDPPAVENTVRDLTCQISEGNPSDPTSYEYEWMYRPTYGNATTDLPPPSGM